MIPEDRDSDAGPSCSGHSDSELIRLGACNHIMIPALDRATVSHLEALSDCDRPGSDRDSLSFKVTVAS